MVIMLHISKLIVKNFKKFNDKIFEFNDKLNIIVGDNDSGKTTLLESIELAFNFSYRGKNITSALSPELFNVNAQTAFINSDKSYLNLPEILIEAYINGVPDYKGTVNSLGEDTEGVRVIISFDEDLIDAYTELLKTPDAITTIPTEFYKIEWLDFSWKTVKFLNRQARCLFVDPTRLHPTYGKNQYISKIVDTTLNKEEQALLNLNYRQLKQVFNDQPQVKIINNKLDSKDEITDKELKIIADTSTANAESGMQLAVDDVSFPMIGKGEQNKIQIKLALQNKADNIDVLLLEEPENHLSHTNLSQLVKYIKDHDKKQTFVSTHSSYVLNKLNLENLCLMASSYIRLTNIDKNTATTLQRLPGYDTLRIALSNRVILVEGPSDELVLKRRYFDKNGCLPEEDGIDIIVVRGIGFKNYLEIAKHIGTKVNVVKDNDGNYQKNIIDYGDKYKEYPDLKFFSSDKNDLYSLEPTLISANSKNEKELDAYAKIVLSKQTNTNYLKEKSLPDKIKMLVAWYKGKDGKENQGGKKVDSAMRILSADNKIKYPKYLIKALNFD